MYIYQGARRDPGWGLRSGLGKGGFRADFPTVYMLISNLTALVLELFIHLNANLFFSSLPLPLPTSLSFLLLQSLFSSFWRHLTADGKMQMNVHMESLAVWSWGCELAQRNAVVTFETGVFGCIRTKVLAWPHLLSCDIHIIISVAFQSTRNQAWPTWD